MNEEQIRKIVREELSFIKSDKFVIEKLFQFADGRNIQTGLTTGTKFGTAATQKIGLYGVDPIIQRSGAAQAAVSTAGSTQSTPYGYQSAAQADGIVTLLNELRAWAVAIGGIKGSA